MTRHRRGHHERCRRAGSARGAASRVRAARRRAHRGGRLRRERCRVAARQRARPERHDHDRRRPRVRVEDRQPRRRPGRDRHADAGVAARRPDRPLAPGDATRPHAGRHLPGRRDRSRRARAHRADGHVAARTNDGARRAPRGHPVFVRRRRARGWGAPSAGSSTHPPDIPCSGTSNTRSALRPLVHHIPDPARRATVDEVLDRFEEHVQPGLRRPARTGDPQRPDVRQLPVRCRATGLGHRRLRRHGALGVDLRLRLHGRGADGRTARPLRSRSRRPPRGTPRSRRSSTTRSRCSPTCC